LDIFWQLRGIHEGNFLLLNAKCRSKFCMYVAVVDVFDRTLLVIQLVSRKRVCWLKLVQRFKGLKNPVSRVAEFRESEAWGGFAFAGEELLQEPFFVGLERVEFLAFGF